MTDIPEMIDPQESSERHGPSQGFKQVLALVLLSGAIVILGAVFVIQRELAQQREAMKWTIAEFGLGSPTINRLSSAFTDQDLDLIADAPQDESEWVRPEKLIFSFIPGTDVDQDTALWKPLTDAIAAATGIEVEHRPLETVGQQIMAMRTCTLHITAMNTGSVPLAVNISGFVPVTTLGDADGKFGVTMQMLVPKRSAVRKIQDLKKKRIMFTSANSNSGFKAPIVILNADFGMQPGIDYDYGFSTSHVESIRMIKSGAVRAAPVASDMLERAIADGEISEGDYRIIYDSERFPPAAFGYLYCLHPELVEKIRATLIDFDLSGTALGKSLGAEKLVPINYKNDWALIRRIDNELGVVHEHESSEVPEVPQAQQSSIVAADEDHEAANEQDELTPDDDPTPAAAVETGDASGTAPEPN